MPTPQKYDEEAVKRGGRRVANKPLSYLFKSFKRAAQFGQYLSRRRKGFRAVSQGDEKVLIKLDD